MIAECFNDTDTYSNTSAGFEWNWTTSLDRRYQWKSDSEKAAEREAHANECRRRDLSVLWIDPLPRNMQIRKPVLIRFNPMWSARRWRSVT